MDSESPRLLSSLTTLEALAGCKHVLHPLVPEKWRFTEDNMEGAVKTPISITKGNMRQLPVLDASTSSIFTVRLHYPAQVKKMYTGLVKPRAISYSEGILFILNEESLSYVDHKGVLKVYTRPETE